MKELLQKLQIGVKKCELDKKELRELFDLIRSDVVKDGDFIKLSPTMIIGKISIARKHKIKKPDGYLQPIGTKNQDLIVFSSDLNGAKDGDFVVAKSAGNKRGRPSAKVIYIVSSTHIKTIAYLTNIGKKMEFVNIDNAMIVPVNAKQKELKNLPLHTVATIVNGELDELLGVLSEPKVDEEIVLRKYSRSLEFSAEVLQEAKSYNLEVDISQYPNRKDLRDLPFITIDPSDAKDFDDAVYFDKEKNIVYVAIADVTSYVNEFSEIDKEARKRGFSVYLPHKSIPMLPRELSENICSLKPNKDRLAFVFKLSLDSSYKVSNYELFEAVIKSKGKYSYEYIENILESSTFSSEDLFIKDWIIELANVTKKLREKRLKKGFSFFNPEIKLILNDKTELIKTEKHTESISHQLIEECMLLANCAASEFFDYGIFRTHGAPTPKSLDILAENLSELEIEVPFKNNMHKYIEDIQKEAKRLDLIETVDRILIRSLKKAAYTFDNIGHFGLGFSKYTHFTSPIRRYTDLVVHRYIKAILNKEKKAEYIKSKMQQIAPQATDLETEVTKIEWQYADRSYARWAEKNIGTILTAEVIDEGDAQKEALLITDDETMQGMRCYMQNPRKKALRVKRFSRIKVMIIEADIAAAKIFVKLVDYV